MDKKQKFNLFKNGVAEPVASNNAINRFVEAVIDYLDKKKTIGKLFDELEDFDGNIEGDGAVYKDLKFKHHLNSNLLSIFRVSKQPLMQEHLVDGSGGIRFHKNKNYFYEEKYYYLSDQWGNQEKDSTKQRNRELSTFIDTFNKIYPGFSFDVPPPKSHQRDCPEICVTV